LRIANVPTAEFKAEIESATPPTIAVLAGRTRSLEHAPASAPETAPATVVDALEDRSGALEGLELVASRLIRETEPRGWHGLLATLQVSRRSRLNLPCSRRNSGIFKVPHIDPA
jgi:hypothetical protein